ncbi:c-type cytochrome [Geminicoccus roseus]|uniref:c-type cytochrome n=1 Tax=Geminicoccus roseus TaxID=404900 RepID=UPI0006840E10|nr:cytochrome c [Geminicoccus roseus]
MQLHRIAAVVIVAVSALSATTALLAQDDDIIAKRQATMKALGKEMGAIKELLTGSPEELAQVREHALKISATAPEIPAMFPEGSDQGKTDALPAVWSDPAGFEAAATRMGELADALAASSDSGDAKQVTAAFATLGKEGCGGCHQTYRKPQD